MPQRRPFNLFSGGAGGRSLRRPFSLFGGASTGPAPLSIAGTPGGATVGTPYNFSPTVSGGSGVKSFALAGTLLAGLSFSSATGAITGTPTTPGTASGLSITVTDSTGSATLGPFAIPVAAAPVQAPGQVTGLALGIATQTAQPLSWTAPGTGGAPSAYTVEYRTPAGTGSWQTASAAVAGTSYTVSGLTASTTYEYRVTATNGAGAGTPSATLTGATAAPSSLGPATASFAVGAPSGTQVAAITGLAAGEFAIAIAPNDGRLALAVGGTVLVVGLSSSAAGTTNYSLTTNQGHTLAIAVTATGTLSVPLAPTLAADNGNGQVRLRITDNAASQQVQKWGIYKAATTGGTPVFQFWAYNPADIRAYLANTGTGYYRATGWNAAGEGPQSAEVTALALATNTNPLRLLGTTLFVNTLFYEPIGADFQTGSTVSVTATDANGTQALSTKTSAGGAIIVYGTFTTGGPKTLTFSETPSGGGTASVSTQVINVVARPVAALSGLKATAQALKARLTAKPTYTDTAIAITDTGTSMPAGYTASHTYFPGRSIPPPASSVAQGPFSPGQNIVAAYDPVTRTTSNQYLSRYGGTNTVLQQRLFKQTWVLGLGSDGGTAVGQIKVAYSDDEGASWKESPDPFFVRWQSGAHYVKIDPGVAPPGGGRIWRVEFANYTYFADNNTTFGFGYEPGETPLAVQDWSPVSAIFVDSFGAGVGASDITKNMGRRATRQIGGFGFWNLAIPSHRYTNPATSNFPLGLDRMGDNVVGSGDFTMPPQLDIIFLNYTINDNSQPDQVQAQAIFTNVLLRARRLRPNALIVLTIGFWSPQDRASASSIASLRNAYADAKDAGIILNDGVAAGWATASGATGSSPYWMGAASVTVTGQIAGNVLTVSNGSGLEPGMYFWSGGSFNGARIYKQLSGTTGGAGTYQLDVQPLAGDAAAGSSLNFQSENYTAAYPVHPNPAGHLWAGDRIADGAAALVDQVLSLGSPILDSAGGAVLDSTGANILT